jgi:hypothetical protein
VKRRKVEVDREDGLHWSEVEGIAGEVRQTGCQAGEACGGGEAVGSLLQPPVSATARIFSEGSSVSQKQQLVCRTHSHTTRVYRNK